jgi:hypothetical protein
VYVRVVRFTDVSAERIEALLARIEESGGPPPGVAAIGLKMMFDERQGTAVVLQYFDTAEDMEAGAQVFSAMDPSETPGTRASVDMCELKLELPPSWAAQGSSQRPRRRGLEKGRPAPFLAEGLNRPPDSARPPSQHVLVGDPVPLIETVAGSAAVLVAA